jgi:hypothetical protein
LTFVVNTTIKVQKDYVAAEPSLCKKTKKLRSTAATATAAGPKCARLLIELRKEAAKQESKLQYMGMEGTWSCSTRESSTASKSKSIEIQELSHS